MVQNSFLQKMEFHINADIRKKCKIDNSLFSSTGNVIIRDVVEIHKFVYNFNQVLKNEGIEEEGRATSFLKSGELNGMGLLDEIFHYVCRIYRRDKNPQFFENAYNYINEELLKKSDSENPLFDLLLVFCNEFPSVEVYKKNISAKDWLMGVDPASGVENKLIALEELLMLRLANDNPAFEPFSLLFNENNLRNEKAYSKFWRAFKEFSSEQVLGNENKDLISFLKAPAEFSPFSIKGQLEYVLQNWKDLLGEWLTLLLSGLDLIAEEEKLGWLPGTPESTPVYHFENILEEYEKFSDDKDWMPNVVLIAKSTLVWLDQLSKKYARKITQLSQIPDEELLELSSAGFNALWLIGLWERSKASARIKQICGNPEAAASAYSLASYEIAEELGGWSSLIDLKERAKKYGIRVAADMVPNHTGMDSKWVIERPDLFMQVKDAPFPSYGFSSEDLCHDERVGVYLEDHYYSKQDCAVVFKRVDHHTGDVRYIYHGNDGTGLPWNDTAQLDFLNPQTREAVIQEILNVAKNFQIIRLDAAMVLAKKHIQRLWYPQPGVGGDIASRSRFALTNEEFNQKIPVEFWRELVDRCTAELPDTLLLAEAFWMMEGYFVRTLGMHRVYNSAFMNMLKKEENEKYRATIKNTMEFDREVLKRYVNFMNNPDEDTALAQFGTGDKYFGVCTMMITMPGLPMFGHGQIEGFEEKYGMEYRKAYYNEEANLGLIERHKKEIFPLIRRRYIFSGVENFFLFDFWNNDLVNENVFAWSNYCHGHRSIVIYNNTYERAFGWIQMSAAYAVKAPGGEKQTAQKRLLPALKLTEKENFFTIFKEQRTQKWYIRSNKELATKGFYAALDGFQCQVFWDIYEVEDTKEKTYKKLYENLAGAGVENIDNALKHLVFAELHKVLADFLDDDYFNGIVEILNDAELKGKTELVKEKTKAFTQKIQSKVIAFFETACKFKKEVDTEKAMISQKVKIEEISAEEIYTEFCRIMKCFMAFGTDTFAVSTKLTSKENKYLKAIKTKLFADRKNIMVYSSSAVLYALKSITTSGTGKDTANLISYWNLDGVLVKIIEEKGAVPKQSSQIIYLIKNMLTLEDTRLKKKSLSAVIHAWFADPYFAGLLNVNEWEGELWFEKEAIEMLTFVSTVSNLIVNFEGECQTENQIEDLRFYANMYYEALNLQEKSKYKKEKLFELLEETSV
ncbi:MAG: alpha-amlyase [Treponema sp.]|nr:MAG: alpha-amlyase [Treponema sp.]